MDTTKTISFSQAWAHCAGTTSYWAWLIAFIVVGAAGLLVIDYIGNKRNTDVSTAQKIWCIVFAFLIFGAIFIRPGQVAANTSQAMAAKGEWLGY